MTQTQAMQSLIERYDCEIYEGPWGVHVYYKSLFLLISFNEKIQKWGFGTMWDKNKQIWSTGEFRESRKLTISELTNLMDMYFPVKTQTTLF